MLEQVKGAKFTALDSMDLWINIAKDSLLAAIADVDCLVVNDAEIRMLTGESNLARAARAVMDLGPRAVVAKHSLLKVIKEVDCLILNDEELELLTGRPLVPACHEILDWGPSVVIAKQGKYGAAVFSKDDIFALPAYPLQAVADPTGAGDTFAGGFVGYVAAQIAAGNEISSEILRTAMAYGTSIASYNVEEFGTERVARLTQAEIDERVHDLSKMTSFTPQTITLRS